MRLDERLGLAYDLYRDCDLAADIGTDHAHLPIALLRAGKCRRMILTDISDGALNNARDNLIRAGMTDRAELRKGDGLAPIREACGMISVLGMGGRTIRGILEAGKDHLRSAPLISGIPSPTPTISSFSFTTSVTKSKFSSGKYMFL